MSDADPAALSRERLAAVLALGLVLLIALVAGAVAINRVNGPGVPVAVAVPTQAPSEVATLPSPTVSAAAPIPFADCTGATFGAALQPLNPPPSVHAYAAAPAMSINTGHLFQATVTTARGPIVLCLQPSLAPLTVNVIVTLARNHFYDGLTFHRVEPNFVIQGGDPKGDGTGGPGFQFADEPVRQRYVDGAVAMANSGPNTNGSQFYVCIGPQCASLPPKYNLFGKVASGLDVAKRIVKGDVIQTVVIREQQ
ncbi:MAG: peptidylprolyl isomerase [Candidatus Dormibacteria bacterium]